jgi:hypothetical protein
VPHQAGEGYEAIETWVEENFDLILSGELPFDFGNPEAQAAADKQLAGLLEQAGASSDVVTAVENLPPTPFVEHVEPTVAAQESKSVFGQVYDALKSFGEKIVSGLRSLFGGG